MDTFNKHAYRILLSAAVAILAIGTVVYHVVEHLSWLDAYYFSVVTLATVGYGDFYPHTTFGKLFTTVYIMTGVGILTAFISAMMKKRAFDFQKKRTKPEK